MSEVTNDDVIVEPKRPRGRPRGPVKPKEEPVSKKKFLENTESREFANTNRVNYLENNTIVKNPIARLEKPKSNVGRKKLFTPTKMRNEINKYLAWCETNDRVPSINGLMIHLKMYKAQFYIYCNYPEFQDIMEQARLVILEWCSNDVYRTPGACAGKIAYMKNTHSWTEKVEQEITRVVSVDEARSRLEMLLPQLIEKLKQQSIQQKFQIEDKVVEAEEVTD